MFDLFKYRAYKAVLKCLRVGYMAMENPGRAIALIGWLNIEA